MSRHMLYVLSAWRFTCCRRVRAFALVVAVGVEWLVVDDFAGLGEDGDRVAVDDHGLHLAAGVLVGDVELP